MSRRYTRRGTALLLVLALLVSMLGAALPVMQKSGAASGAFATAYTALLEKAPVAQADLKRDPYGLCRLVVTGYGGKDYGAVAAAVTDGLAILQYDTPLAARKAAVGAGRRHGGAGQPVPIRDRYEPDRQPLPLGGGDGGHHRFLRPAADPGSPGSHRSN